MRTEFRNEPLSDFCAPGVTARFERAMAAVREACGAECPLVVGGRRTMTAKQIVTRDPCRPGRIVGRAASAGRAEALDALAAAEAAQREWRRWDPAARARVLWKTAAALRARREALCAWEAFEVGKTWREADADVAEAIDFLEYYGRQATGLSLPQPVVPVASEEDELTYLPLGVGVVIPPWNFPLAITAGMTAAAIVCGNTVVLKPSSLSPAIAYRLVEALEDAGLPPGVVNYLPGPGGEIGDVLVAHPAVAFVSFTGSREVGVRLSAMAAATSAGQRCLKRVIAEMGGKDTVIVDEGVAGDSDTLDAAAADIVASAFGFQGQKCSACSRLVAVGRAYEPVVRRVAERAAELRVGPAADAEAEFSAVAGAGQFAKVEEYIAVGEREGRRVLGRAPVRDPESEGYFIPPTIFADVDPHARISQEEIFGPVLACTPAPDFAAAVAIANDNDYGLTGAVFSTDRSHLEYARREFDVGNLYFNRPCTGALVGAHPFGGFRMSGTDSKAGGPDYLKLFSLAKVVAERF